MNHPMKTIVSRIAIAAITVAASTSYSSAIPLVSLDGSGAYSLGNSDFRDSGRGLQSGRYRNLGRTYYHTASYDMDEINNNTNFRSGSLSFEFWGLSYYKALRGPVLMTYGLDPLGGDSYYQNAFAEGFAVSLNRYRYPQLNLVEYTRRGWKWRDALNFSNRDDL
jgi:hypothetical protein